MFRREYPNPQFQRDNFCSLNGEWLFHAAVLGDGWKTIRVPFCPESELSGIGYTDFIRTCTYKKVFDLEPVPEFTRTVLHFGAVNCNCRVYLNGTFLGEHRGGYAPFWVDVTRWAGQQGNELTVEVENDLSANVPSGKQSDVKESHGCFYTRCTGIWQSVWLEHTPAKYIRSLKMTPHLEPAEVDVDVLIEGKGTVKAEIFYEGAAVGSAEFEVRGHRKVRIPLSQTHLWEPGRGRLYDVVITYGADRVSSYFGLREVGYDGMRFQVNGKTVYQRFVLDQGYYPDGIYTARDDEALRRDIELGMELGFNGARLHQKVFEPRFLYHCDRLGYMVWGEFPSWGIEYDDLSALGTFVGEWSQIVERDYNHPCIVTWCPLNETWCSLKDDTKHRDPRFPDAVYALTKALDPTRPCVGASGGFHGHVTDLYDFHDYLDPETVEGHMRALTERDELIMDFLYAPEWAGEEDLRYRPGMPTNASEYGGITFATQKTDGGWGYRSLDSEEVFAQNYIRLTECLLNTAKLSGFCYTQLYDVEQEQNGLLLYSREHKFSKKIRDQIAACNRQTAAIEKSGQ